MTMDIAWMNLCFAIVKNTMGIIVSTVYREFTALLYQWRNTKILWRLIFNLLSHNFFLMTK